MCNILIIEENQQVIDDFAFNMRKHFANAILLPAVSDEQSLQDLLKKQHVEIAVISTDIKMPVFEAYKTLLEKNANTKAMLISHQADFAMAQQALRHGMVDYLLKPIDKHFVYAMDRAIKSINQVSLLNVEEVDQTNVSLDLQHNILRYIHENAQKDISLKSLADHLYLSSHYTSRIVKNILGMTFSKYLLTYRIEIAKKNLSTTDKCISEIAQIAGFNDANYFTKKFKAVTGIIPKDYRKTYSGIPTIVTVDEYFFFTFSLFPYYS